MQMNSNSIWRTIAVCAGLGILVTVFAASREETSSIGGINDAKSVANVSGPAPDTLTVKPDESMRSLWLDSERRRYSSLLQGQPCDTLVVPLQSQRFGFDRATRSLMTAQLSLALAGQSGRCVVDPYIASDALGEGMRRFEPASINALAVSVKATTLVTVYVGHDGKGNMEVFARVDKSSQAGSSVFRQSALKQWNGIAFTDERPPFVAWQEKLPEIVAALDLGKVVAKAPVAASSEAFELPDGPAQLVTSPFRGPLEDARRYELLAALGPESSFRPTERLFEKAWLAATRVADTPESRRIRARALMHLGYRPAAIALLAKDESPPGRVLRALLDGNLPESEAAAEEIDSPVDAFVAGLEIRDLRFAYGRADTGEPLPPSLSKVGKMSSNWNTLLAERGGDGDDWQVNDNLALKGILDSLYPIEGFSVEETLRAHALTGTAVREFDYQLLVKRHVDRLIAQQPRRFCCTSFALHPSELDFLQLVSVRGLSNIEHRFDHELRIQGHFDRAIELLDTIDAEYAGHPHFAALRANALVERTIAQKDTNEAEYLRRAKIEARKAVYYEQSGTPYSRVALVTFGIPSAGSAPFMGAYERDYPPKVDWASPEDGLKYSSAFPYTRMLSNASPAQMEAVLAEVKARFHGSRTAENFVALASPAPPGGADAATLRAKIERDPGNWNTYTTLARVLLTNGDADGIVAMAEKYPGFARDSTEHPVALSNQAVAIASMLFWRGYLESARKMYALAAGYVTGSDASLMAAQRVAILDGDIGTAAEYAQTRAIRYQGDYATRDFVTYLFALGYPEQAWPVFLASAEKSKIPEFWFAALVGKRVEGASDASVAEWLSSDSIRSIDIAGDAPAVRLGLMYFLIDRNSFAGLPESVARIEGKPLNRVDIDTLMRPLPDAKFYSPIPRSKFQNKNPIGEEGELVASPYVLFAPAYVALRNKNYQAAVDGFLRFANYYAIEGDRYNPNIATALPYFAFSAAKTGDKIGLKSFIEGLMEAENRKGPGNSSDAGNDIKFQQHLALAYFAGLAGDADGGLKELRLALNDMPLGTGTNMINAYQYAETCIWLYDETKEIRYRDIALDWARNYQRMEPTMAWAYALEAAYGDAKDPRHTRAVAVALHLDRNSYWLGKVSKSDIKRARSWLPKNNPFQLKEKQKVNAI